MLKFQIFLISILVSCIAFVSCERAQQMVGPTLPPEATTEPGNVVQPEDMMDMTDMGDSSVMGPSVVINELMADNDNIVADPQGDYDDWLELHNLTDSAIVLTGMYLTDKVEEPRKWKFPQNTEIPANGYLIVWLDDDEDASEGLHANFKLSKGGETAILVDTNARGNKVLDSIAFGEQETDKAYGRLPDGTGDFQVVQATPGASNMPK